MDPELVRRLEKLASLIRQLQEALQGNRTVSGVVDAAGSATLGEGFSAANVGTGEYEVTFDPPFGGEPVFVAMPGASAFVQGVKQANGAPPTASVAAVVSFNTMTGTLTDGPFHFVATGPA